MIGRGAGRGLLVIGLAALGALECLGADDIEDRAPDQSERWRLVVQAAPAAVAPRAAWIRLDLPSGVLSDATYLWQCGEGLPKRETVRAQRGCWYDSPGRYRPAVTVRRPDRTDVTVRARDEIVVVPRPPLRAAIDATPSNRWWRAPLTVSASVQLTGRLDDEPIREVTWLWDELPIGAATSDAATTVEAPAMAEPGVHRLAAIVRTAWRTATAIRVIEARANQPPQCTIEQTAAEPPAPPATVKLTARCADPDGTIVSYRWEFPDRQHARGPDIEWTVTQAGRYPVHLQAHDDGGAAVTTETIVEWSR